jgi:23S rRNA (adenine2503-C2)-methyltransferase
VSTASTAAASGSILARTPEEWAEWALGNGGRTFHGKQIFKWIQQRGVLDPAQMSDLPATMRPRLAEAGVRPVVEVSYVHRSTDGTRKLLLKLHDGASVETVLLPSGTRAASEDADAASADTEEEEETQAIRVTQCISTQVGCAMGCVFCASGVAGLKRHMTPDEIIAQVLVAKQHLEPGESLRNIVFMGMGEPLHNYDGTARTLRLLTHADGIGLSSRRVTVSTSGLVPEIARLGADFSGQVSLAVSLHAADDETRTRLMPINKKYPLAELLPALRAYPMPKRRRITIEYTLVAGRNDSVDEAAKLVKLLRNVPVKINLIPMNPIEASSLGPSEMKSVHAFQDVLVNAGYSCFIRKRRGDDVAAACGQLVLLGAKAKVRVNRD